jgi:hypothetical protein
MQVTAHESKASCEFRSMTGSTWSPAFKLLDRIEKEIPNKKSQGNLKTAARAYAEFLPSAR